MVLERKAGPSEFARARLVEVGRSVERLCKERGKNVSSTMKELKSFNLQFGRNCNSAQWPIFASGLFSLQLIVQDHSQRDMCRVEMEAVTQPAINARKQVDASMLGRGNASGQRVKRS